jgi:hypothetical protein
MRSAAALRGRCVGPRERSSESRNPASDIDPPAHCTVAAPTLTATAAASTRALTARQKRSSEC